MTARRFRLEIAGETVHGLAFATEQELDAFMAARAIDVEPAAQVAPSVPRIEIENTPRPRGRPSFNDTIAQAVRSLGRQLRRSANVSERARLVQTHVAKICTDPAAIPSLTTIREYLGARRVAGKVAGKYAEKSKRARVRRTGGRTTC